jgi:cysteine desulfurase
VTKTERCRFIPAEREIDDTRFSPYIVQAAFRDVPGEVMARALDDMGFAVSTGSACSSASPERPVLAAMGVEENLSLEGIRISQGWSTTDEEIDLLAAAISEVLQFL